MAGGGSERVAGPSLGGELLPVLGDAILVEGHIFLTCLGSGSSHHDLDGLVLFDYERRSRFEVALRCLGHHLLLLGKCQLGRGAGGLEPR